MWAWGRTGLQVKVDIRTTPSKMEALMKSQGKVSGRKQRPSGQNTAARYGEHQGDQVSKAETAKGEESKGSGREDRKPQTQGSAKIL